MPAPYQLQSTFILKCPCSKSFQIPFPVFLCYLSLLLFSANTPPTQHSNLLPLPPLKSLLLRPPTWLLVPDPSAQEPASSPPIHASFWDPACVLRRRTCCLKEPTWAWVLPDWSKHSYLVSVPPFSLRLKLARAAVIMSRWFPGGSCRESCSFSSTLRCYQTQLGQ